MNILSRGACKARKSVIIDLAHVYRTAIIEIPFSHTAEVQFQNETPVGLPLKWSPGGFLAESLNLFYPPGIVHLLQFLPVAVRDDGRAAFSSRFRIPASGAVRFRFRKLFAVAGK